MNLKCVVVARFCVCAVFCIVVSTAFGDTYTFTSTADFQSGNPINVNSTNNQLQINTWTQSKSANPPVMPYLWVPCSERGTIVRIATANHYSSVDQREVTTGEILGEYRTAPELCPAGAGSSPSRTAVDFDGNAWVGNRNNVTVNDVGYGHAVKIGSGLSFQWIDRNCNGVLDTSRGLGDIRPWPNPDGVCESDDVRYAHDELILLYEVVEPKGIKSVSVDRSNDVWIGGTDLVGSFREHKKLDGQSGQVLTGFAHANGCGGYSGVVDRNGVLWSSSGSLASDYLLRRTTDGVVTCFSTTPAINYSYGLGVAADGYIWNSRWPQQSIWRVSPAGVYGALGIPYWGTSYENKGVAVSPDDGDVWIAHPYVDRITRMTSAAGPHELLSLPANSWPTGMAFDWTGNVWTTNQFSSKVSRIVPGNPSVVTTPVDLYMQGLPVAQPYGMGRMTGVELMVMVAPAGVWTKVVDGGAAGRVWNNIAWTASSGNGGTISVQARVADEQAQLGSRQYIDIQNGASLVSGGVCALAGRYLQVRVQLNAHSQGETPWPTMQDLTVTSQTSAQSDTDADGIPDCFDNCVSVSNPDQEDCNHNGEGDACEIDETPSLDRNDNCMLDECEVGSCCKVGLECDDFNVRGLSVGECLDQGGTWAQGRFCDIGGFACPGWSVCASASGSCYSAHGSPACNDQLCCDKVCTSRGQYGAFCCNVAWDSACVGYAQDDCCTGIFTATPPSGTVDARRPHPQASQLPRYGIGVPYNPADPNDNNRIKLTLKNECFGVNYTDAFVLCENVSDPLLGANYIDAVTIVGQGVNEKTYEIKLARPITVGSVTRIEHRETGAYVEYTSHPANINGNTAASPSDILDLIDHINGVRVPPLTIWQCDVDRSNLCAAPDIIAEIDLLNGAGEWAVWNGTSRPSNTYCPRPAPWLSCVCDGGDMEGFAGRMQDSSMADSSTENEIQSNSLFAEGVQEYLVNQVPDGNMTEDEVVMIANALITWCVEHFTPEERKVLALWVEDSSVVFAGVILNEARPELIDQLRD